MLTLKRRKAWSDANVPHPLLWLRIPPVYLQLLPKPKRSWQSHSAAACSCYVTPLGYCSMTAILPKVVESGEVVASQILFLMVA